MKKIINIFLILFIAITVNKLFADESQMRSDQPILKEIIKKAVECLSLDDKYIEIVDTNMIDEVEIILEDKQKAAWEADYDTCKSELQTSVAKF